MTFGRTSLDDLSARRKSLYLHRTTQHTKTKTNIHTLSGIQTHDLSVQAIKAYALDDAATGTGVWYNRLLYLWYGKCKFNL